MITWNNKPIKRIRGAWDAAKQRAGVGGRKIPMYAIRHAFVTQLLHAGVDIKTISEMAGHDAQTMIKTYAHTMDAVKQWAIANLVTPLGTQKSKKIEWGH
ncbi:MAG: hypothetical protein CSA33_03915 [Desulfobulbus propionicus]|nr:MAG: hypothetical protein CSA33_03915 [Desulfobulbus propionicus]